MQGNGDTGQSLAPPPQIQQDPGILGATQSRISDLPRGGADSKHRRQRAGRSRTAYAGSSWVLSTSHV